jgi:hypothetical protein
LSNRAPYVASVLLISGVTLPISTAWAQSAPAPPPAQDALDGAPAPQPPLAGDQAQPAATGSEPAPSVSPPAAQSAPALQGFTQAPAVPAPAVAPVRAPEPRAPVEPRSEGDAAEAHPESPVRFGQAHQVALSAERLTGYTHSWSTWNPDRVNGAASNGLEISTEGDSGAFLGDSSQAGLGFDLVFDSGVTFGAAFSYAASGADQTVKSGMPGSAGTTAELGHGSASTATVRLGKVHMFDDAVGLWPRLGLNFRTTADTTYDYSDSSPLAVEKETTSELFGVNARADLVLSPVPHFALLIGPTCDIGFSGTLESKSGGVTAAKGDFTSVVFGIAAGIMGYMAFL